jgi:hypothetical protein
MFRNSILLLFTIIWVKSIDLLYKGNLTPIEKANLITSQIPLIYINDQVNNCTSIQNPDSYLNCQAAITEPIASCCHIQKSESSETACIAVPNDSADLYIDALTKLGYNYRCPVLNNPVTVYVDTMISKLSASDVMRLVDASDPITDLYDMNQNCTSIRDATSYESCAAAINSIYAQCCYLNGSNGTYPIDTCVTIPNHSISVMSTLYAQVGSSIYCDTSFIKFTIAAVLALLFVIN